MFKENEKEFTLISTLPSDSFTAEEMKNVFERYDIDSISIINCVICIEEYKNNKDSNIDYDVCIKTYDCLNKETSIPVKTTNKKEIAYNYFNAILKLRIIAS